MNGTASSFGDKLGRLAGIILSPVDLLMTAIQRALGIKAMPWVFLAPNLVFVVLFALLPVVLNIVFSVTGGDRLYPDARFFVGGENFQALASCGDYLQPSSCTLDRFWRAVHNTLIFVPIKIVVLSGSALITAIVLNRPIVGRAFFRAMFFFPVMLSPVVVALIWKWILQRQGILNVAMSSVGNEPVNWLSDPSMAFFWSIFVTAWAKMGFYTLIFLAGLQSIPRDVYEAAKMDAASPWRTFTRITLPLLKPTILVVLVLCTISAVQTFDEIYVLTGGGPGSATLLLIQYIYDTGFAASPRNLGLAAAASLLVGAVLLGLTIVQLQVSRRGYDG